MISNEYSDVYALENALLSRMALLIENCVHDTGKATILLSGGSTPVELYRKMSHLDLDWTRVYVGLVDERYVETHDTMSNERLNRETLLQNRAKHANFMGMVHTFQSPEDNLIQVNQAYEQHFSQYQLLSSLQLQFLDSYYHRKPKRQTYLLITFWIHFRVMVFPHIHSRHRRTQSHSLPKSAIMAICIKQHFLH